MLCYLELTFTNLLVTILKLAWPYSYHIIHHLTNDLSHNLTHGLKVCRNLSRDRGLNHDFTQDISYVTIMLWMASSREDLDHFIIRRPFLLNFKQWGEHFNIHACSHTFCPTCYYLHIITKVFLVNLLLDLKFRLGFSDSTSWHTPRGLRTIWNYLRTE